LFVAETVYLNESRGLSFFLPVPASVELTFYGLLWLPYQKSADGTLTPTWQ